MTNRKAKAKAEYLADLSVQLEDRLKLRHEEQGHTLDFVPVVEDDGDGGMTGSCCREGGE